MLNLFLNIIQRASMEVRCVDIAFKERVGVDLYHPLPLKFTHLTSNIHQLKHFLAEKSNEFCV